MAENIPFILHLDLFQNCEQMHTSTGHYKQENENEKKKK